MIFDEVMRSVAYVNMMEEAAKAEARHKSTAMEAAATRLSSKRHTLLERLQSKATSNRDLLEQTRAVLDREEVARCKSRRPSNEGSTSPGQSFEKSPKHSPGSTCEPVASRGGGAASPLWAADRSGGSAGDDGSASGGGAGGGVGSAGGGGAASPLPSPPDTPPGVFSRVARRARNSGEHTWQRLAEEREEIHPVQAEFASPAPGSPEDLSSGLHEVVTPKLGVQTGADVVARRQAEAAGTAEVGAATPEEQAVSPRAGPSPATTDCCGFEGMLRPLGYLTTFVITINIVCMLAPFRGMTDAYAGRLELISRVCTFYFISEASIKVTLYGRGHIGRGWQEYWNNRPDQCAAGTRILTLCASASALTSDVAFPHSSLRLAACGTASTFR